MSGSNGKRFVYRALCSLACLFALSYSVTAEQIPIKGYTTADGLPVDAVLKITRDSRGFLWLCTRDGLCKFDGYQFTTYRKQQGLPHPQVNDLIESRDGTYWVATNGGGVCRFNPAERSPTNSASRFKVYSLEYNTASNIVNCLCEDREGRIWAGTDWGLFYFDPAQDRFITAVADPIEVYSLLVDRQGLLWVGAGNQLWRRSPDGQLIRYIFQAGRDLGRIFALLEDDKGKLWAGSWHAGLFELVPKLLPLQNSALEIGKTKGFFNHYTITDGTLTGVIQDLHQSADGHLWIATSPDLRTLLGGGLLEFDGKRFRRYGKPQGLTSDQLECIEEDSGGNFWLGSVDGAMKIARKGFTTFGEADGLPGGALAIFENKSGELCVITDKGMVVNRFADGRFISTRFNVPKGLNNSQLWGSYLTFQDHEGDWWVPTLKGLMRFPGVAQVDQLARARPKAHYLLKGEQNGFDIFRMFEDSRGDIWVGLGTRDRDRLLKWERATEKFRYYTEADGVPPMDPPTSFCEDTNGNLWIGLYSGGLLRYRSARFTLFGTQDGLPSGLIINLHLDSSGRLWIASTSDGVGRIDDTSRDRPEFVRFTVATGLSSNVVYSITEDKWGRIYFGTPNSVDRLNPGTGNIKRYRAADGFPRGGALLGYRDASGALWFSGSYEIARLVPEPDTEQPPAPPVLISGLSVAGIAQPLADLGETGLRGFEFEPSQNHIEIDFVGLAFGAAETLQYQYTLEGADRDWKPMTTLRTVNYASLAPGTYRFLVRARNAEGQFSSTPASVEFTILAPLWQRWWFVAMLGALVGLAAYVLYRYRVRRLLELERVRTRIAADLHDDIGANLTKIGILSEIVRQQVSGVDKRMAEPLLSIAHISRESVSSMSDIVWAINPKRDTLRDLTRRMRGFAGEIFANRDIEFELRAPDSETYQKLGADVRRTVFLIFKEAVNNIVRHSGCDKADIDLRVEGSLLVLTVSDDGNGFDTALENAGNGLASMRSRAASMGGEVEIDSNKPSGTRVTLRLPIKQGKSSVTKHDGTARR